MEQFLDQAELLLRDIIQSHNTSAIVALHHIRDLAKVLDKLGLYDECRLTGTCALELAEALGIRSLEFRHEQAETLTLIAGLSVYRPRARTLFIQAVSICEEVVENNASHSNKNRLLIVLDRAGYWALGHLRAQWLGRAIQLMTNDLPPTMVHPNIRSDIYHNYGYALYQLKQYSNALEAYHGAISIRRPLVSNNPTKHNPHLAQALLNLSVALSTLGKYGDAIAASKEALEICTTMSAQDPLRYNELMAIALLNYGFILGELNQVSQAAEVEKQAISVVRNLARTGKACTRLLLKALNNYGSSCGSIGQHTEAVLVYQESILLGRALAATDSEEEKSLTLTLHNIAHSFLALGQYAEANTTATEALIRTHGRVLEDCDYAPDFKSCFVCQRAMVTDPVREDSAPLPFVLAKFSPRPAEHSGADAPHEPIKASTKSTSAHIPPTNAARRLGLGRPGLASEAPVPVHRIK